MNNDVFNKARNFVYRNARPVELALWRYSFEGGSRKDVIDALSFYQNADGGFGHAIEPDFWNPNSTPVATWRAIGVLKEVGIDKDEKTVKGVLSYLESGKDFADGKWLNTVKSNNDYPHAIWWECRSENGDPCDNPTVSLAGFALKYAQKGSALYNKAAEIARAAVKSFVAEPITEMHVLRCYMELYEYGASTDGFDVFDLSEFKNALFAAVKNAVCTDPDKWFTEYVCKPSMFYDQTGLVFDVLGKDLCKKEGELLLKEQLADGSYPVTWLWYNDYKEYHVSANWWRAIIVRNNMLYLKDLGML